MASTFEILVASADLENRRRLTEILTKLGLDPVCASTLRECHDIFAQTQVGLIFCDPHLADGSYEELLSKYAPGGPKPRVVLTSSTADWEEFRKATRLGAFDVIAVPCRPTDVEWMVIQARRDEQRRPSEHLKNAEFPRANARAASAS